MVSRAVVIATDVTADGHREVLGVEGGDSESEDFWTEFFRSLRDRGLHGASSWSSPMPATVSSKPRCKKHDASIRQRHTTGGPVGQSDL